MDIEYDPQKNEQNIALRGLSFDLVQEFDFSTALVVEDRRKDYKEKRYQAIGFIRTRLFVVVFTYRNSTLRVISLRKANKREVRLYEERT